jgi:hypothetical protein
MRLLVLLVLLATTASAATVTGRVVQDGFRVAEYGVFIDPAHPTAVQDGDGRFTLHDVPPGRHRIKLVGWAFARREIDIDVAADATTVALGTITVERGRTLSGQVVDATGALVDGATVIVYETRPIDLAAPELALMAGGAQLAVSSHDGTFTINGLPESVVGLHALAFGADLVSAERDLERHTWSVELAIGKLGTITGKVTNRRQMSTPIITARPAGFTGKPVLAGVDPAGRFRLDVPAGIYDLAFLDEPLSAPLQVVVVGDRARQVTMTAPTRHASLDIQAKDCLYVRLLGARPGARQPRTEIAFETCEDDRVRFPRLPTGRYRVCIDTDEEAACKPIHLERPVTLRLPPGAHGLRPSSH